MWLITIISETNRAPFDFAEGESELVSGFNVEYSSGRFGLLFLAEMSNILFMCILTISHMYIVILFLNYRFYTLFGVIC